MYVLFSFFERIFIEKNDAETQPAFTCSKLAIETLEQRK